MLRGLLLIIPLIVVAGLCSAPLFARNSGPQILTLKVGAGGFLTGLDISTDGTTIVIRTDTYGAWVSTKSRPFQQVVTVNSMPATNCCLLEGSGVYEIAVAPSLATRLYMIFNGLFYVSSDRGQSWTRTTFPGTFTHLVIDKTRVFGRYIAVDPQNPDVVIAGTQGGGVYMSTDAGGAWTQISGFATPSTGTYSEGGGYLVAFDPSSRTSSGVTQGIYISVYGTGVYHSTDGGSSFAKTNGTPTTHKHMIVDNNGIVWLVDDSDTLHKYSGGTWSSISAPGSSLHAVAADPNNASRVFVSEADGTLHGSSNGGITWYKIGDVKYIANDVPWIADYQNAFLYNSSGDIRFNPAGSNTLFFASGIGLWTANPPNTKKSMTWASKSAGIEQLVSNWIISPNISGAKPIVTAWDFGVYYISNPDVYQMVRKPVNVAQQRRNPVSELSTCWSADWASTSPSTIVVICNSPPYSLWGDTSSVSSDGGQTWTQFGTVPNDVSSGYNGGSIAASTPTNWVWAVGNGGNVFYTTNGGSSWSEASGFAGAGGFAYYLDRQIIAADRVNRGTFYLYVGSTGTYKSTNSGANWTEVNSTPFANDGYNAQMRSVPGNAGHLFYTSGWQSGSHPNTQLFYRSTNGGATWTQVSNVEDVWSFGFGKPKPGGGGYPAIYIYGWVNGVGGIWRSDDNASTWEQMSDLFPLGSFDTIKVIEGDNNVYGNAYIGFAGSGFAFVTLNDPLRRDLTGAMDNR